MATKSQRKKKNQAALAKRRKRTRSERQRRDPPAGNVRHRQRLASQRPRPWDGELTEDVAVLDDSALESLSAELVDQVVAVREALQAACDMRGDEALHRVSRIPRSSPLSQWRLFVRGLVAWLADEPSDASTIWERLDRARRPGRIATAMMAALCTGGELAEDNGPLDAQLCYHAKLLRRIRVDRAAIRVAEETVGSPEESKELLIGPNKIKALHDFATDFRETEPDVVAAVEQTGLARAFAQNYSDLFAMATKAFRGPRHDPRNSLLTYFYHLRFDDDELAKRHLELYLTKDLPKNEKLSGPLRGAIASQIHLTEAMLMVCPNGFAFGFGADPSEITRHFRAAIAAYPAHRQAFREYTNWIEGELDDELSKRERKQVEGTLANVMTKWSESLPNDVEPRLWLVNFLLENEETDEAKPHVDWLAGARQDDPRVRATPWKWQLLEAMRLCRRKAWLPKVPEKLDAAESIWPAWLSKQWLPYLRAAWLLRCGKREELARHRSQMADNTDLGPNSLADACMMLGAAQRMRVVAADLKPLRAPVEAAVKKIRQVPYDDLLAVSNFFWDLQRTQLWYPAYRMHGGKLAHELFRRLQATPSLVSSNTDDDRIHAAVLLISQHRLFGSSDGNMPSWYSRPVVREHPMFAAAQINALLKNSANRSIRQYAHVAQLLRSAAPLHHSPYYRSWFVTLADEFDEAAARESHVPDAFFDIFRRAFADTNRAFDFE